MSRKTHKKNLIVSYKNLTDELKRLLVETYPDGWTDYIKKTLKPNGESIFAVPLETEDTMYMVKFDVKVDSGMVEEDIDKTLYEEEKSSSGDELITLSDDIEKIESGESSAEGPLHLHHGDYEDAIGDNAYQVAQSELQAEDLDFDDDEADDNATTKTDADPTDEEMKAFDEGDFMDSILHDNPLDLAQSAIPADATVQTAPAPDSPDVASEAAAPAKRKNVSTSKAKTARSAASKTTTAAATADKPAPKKQARRPRSMAAKAADTSSAKSTKQ